MIQTPSHSATRAVHMALALTAAFTVVSALPFISERLGQRFVPDPTWFSGLRLWLVGVSGILALGVFLALMATPSRGWVFNTLRWCSPVVYGFVFYMGLTTAVPLVWTTFAGRPAAMIVTVAHPHAPPTALCRPAVQLDGLPLLFDRLCNVPSRLILTLSPGDKVMLIGRRSPLGVFYDEARLLPRGDLL